MRLFEVALQLIEAVKMPDNMACIEALKNEFQNLLDKDRSLTLPENILKSFFEKASEEILIQWIKCITNEQRKKITLSTLSTTIVEIPDDSCSDTDILNNCIMLKIRIKDLNCKTVHIGKELKENENFCLSTQKHLNMKPDSSLLFLKFIDRKVYAEEQQIGNEKNSLAVEVNKENVKDGDLYMIGTMTIRIKTVTPKIITTEINGAYKKFEEKVNVLDEVTGVALIYKSKWWVIECANHPIRHIVEGKSVFISPNTRLVYKGFKIMIR